jgi:cytoskeletal protein CcmA (bactofilin family)
VPNFSSKNFLGSLDTPWSSGSQGHGGSESLSSESGSTHLKNNSPVEIGRTKFEERFSNLKGGSHIRGSFECEGDLVLEGIIEGDVVVEGSLTVLESGTVLANVRASSVKVFGKVVGDIFCSERVELHAGAQVRGNLKTVRLLIQDGVVFDGRCEMLQERDPESDDVFP